jgi:hypothetical protein
VKAGGKQRLRLPCAFSGLQGFIFQKIILFITIAVRTSKPTRKNYIPEGRSIMSYIFTGIKIRLTIIIDDCHSFTLYTKLYL